MVGSYYSLQAPLSKVGCVARSPLTAQVQIPSQSLNILNYKHFEAACSSFAHGHAVQGANLTWTDLGIIKFAKKHNSQRNPE